MNKWYTPEVRRLVKSIPVPQKTAPIMVAEFETHITFAIDPPKDVIYSDDVKLATDAYLAKIYRALARILPTQIRGFYANYGYHEELQEASDAQNS